MADKPFNLAAERNVKRPTTDIETLIHIVKGSLGAGIFAMPAAFRNLGLWAGFVGTIVVCFVCTYCIHMLVECAQTLCYRRRIAKMSYADVSEQAFLEEGKERKTLAKVMRYITLFFLATVLMGILCIYLITTARTVQQLIDMYHPNNGLHLRVWIAILSIPLVFLCLIRRLKFLVPFSLIANILIIIALGITCVFIADDLPGPSEREAVAELIRWPTFFGISIFALECINVALSVENDMKTPEHFTGCPSVLVVAMTIVGVLYTTLGFLGYLKFGYDVEVNVSLNLPVENYWAQSAKVMVGSSLYFSILLQNYVLFDITWEDLEKYAPENRKLLCEIILRIVLIILCSIISVAFPDLGPFISLMGAVCLSTLGLILPSILDLVVFRANSGYGWGKIHLIKNILIIIFGIIGFIAGTIVSLRDFDIDPIKTMLSI